MNRPYLNSLQWLRVFAFLSIFLAHINSKYLNKIGIGNGRWGVSIFLILSGFLMTYNYYGSGRIKTISIRDNFFFLIRKIRKLYPLHILTMLMVFVLFLVGEEREQITILFEKLVLNVLLIQEWFPVDDISINGVSWYLCTVAFSYLLFPYINDRMEKKYNISIAILMIILSIGVQCLIGVLGIELSSYNEVHKILNMRSVFFWITYFFPFTRFWEFFLGCNLAYIFVNREHGKKDELYYTIFEIISIISVVITRLICLWNSYDNSENWWEPSIVFSFSSILIVYCFAIGKGKISKLLNNKVLLHFAELTPYAFLLHVPIFRYIWVILFHFPGVDGQYIYSEYGNWVMGVLGMVFTILVCEIWERATNRFDI